MLPPSEEEKLTRVLQGHIAIDCGVFPIGRLVVPLVPVQTGGGAQLWRLFTQYLHSRS